MPIKSYVNQPDRVFINSSDDITTAYNGSFNIFQANYKTTIVGAKRCQLLRATIPTPGPALPDYCLEFWYAKKDEFDEYVSDTNLACIRILPYGFVPDPSIVNYAVNRYLSSYVDFIDLLNQASANDDIAYNPYWKGGNDLVFSLNPTTNKISVTGSDPSKFYQILGYGTSFITENQNAVLLPPGAYSSPTASSQSHNVIGYDLNLRVGFAMPCTYNGWDVSVGSASIFRGFPSTVPSMKTVAGGVAIVADSYPNLVRSQCIYLYSNIAVASAMGSNDRHNLLCVIPVNSPALGVTNYTALTVNFLTKVAYENLQNINIEMLDDADQPYTLPDNAQVNLEIAFKYCED